jgi:hemolysin activation/secretion protein
MGRKKIKENPDINPEVYDSLNLTNSIYKASLLFEGYIPLYKNLVLTSGIRAAYIDNENLFTNELYRIGGLRTLRGFDEESLYASAFTIINIEARYLFERNSFVSLFWNGGWYESEIVSSYNSDKPWGFGAGISFDSQAGIFSLYYALGKESGNPIDLKKAKIHFGYTSLF